MLHEDGAGAGVEKRKPAIVAADEGRAQRHQRAVARQQALIEIKVGARVLDETAMGVHHAFRHRGGAGGKNDRRRIVLGRPRQRRVGGRIRQIARNGRRGTKRAAAFRQHRRNGFDTGAKLRIAGGDTGRQRFHRSVVDKEARRHLAADGRERRRGLAGVQRHRQGTEPHRAEPGGEINRARRAQQRERLARLGAKRREQRRGAQRQIVELGIRQTRAGIDHRLAAAEPARGARKAIGNSERQTDRHGFAPGVCYCTLRPIWAAIRLRWICEVPAAMVAARASRKCRCMSNSML